MQVFTRCVNYCKWSRCCNRLPGSWCKSIWYHSTARKEKHSNQTNTSKQQNHTETKQRKTKTPQEPKHHEVEWHIQKQRWNVMTRQLMCPVLSRSSLKQQLKAKHFKDDREVPSKKSRSAETQDPPSQDPGDRITKPCRHNKHQCTSIASICRAVWKIWGWTESETKVRHTEWKEYSSNIYRPLRVLSCVLWRSSFTYSVTRLLKVSACAQIFTAQIGVQWSNFLCHTQKDRWVRCHRRVLL